MLSTDWTGAGIIVSSESVFGRNDSAGCRYIVFKYVTKEYDLYLKDVAQYELLHDVSTDIIGIYDNTNLYTNIVGGVGILGMETVSAYDLENGSWHYGRIDEMRNQPQ